ncbi:MAG: ankyrin repeat domain-containing protein [Spirochaetales bacterium]|nr:ankyrin repeat domain-containing protein [Spirochaetales bacterium]
MKWHQAGRRTRERLALYALVCLLTAAGLSNCRVLGPAPEDPAAPAAARPKAEGLVEAAEQGDLESARAAVERNPDLLEREDDAGWSAAAHAAWNGHKEVYDYLVSQGAPTNVFTEAALGPLQSLVDRLRTNPLAVNAQDPRHRAPPLTWAVRTGNRAGVDFLIDMGAEVDLPDRGGATALHAAVSAGREEIARILLHAGADPEAREAGGRTPLHVAADAGNLKLCLMLLEAGADADAKDGEGNTALHLAAGRGDFELCEYLLFLGADAGLVNRRGLSPGELAEENGYAEVAALLRPREK